jgi:hypothetical protein
MSQDLLLKTAQEACAAAVRTLQETGNRLRRAASSVPEPPDDVLEGRAPWTVAAEVRGTIECFLNDHLAEAVTHLEKAALVTEEELLREWEGRRGKGG